MLQGEFLNDRRLWDGGIPAVNGRPADVPINTFYGASNDQLQNAIGRGTLTIEHRVSSAWSLRNVFRYTNLDTDGVRTTPRGVTNVGGVLMVDRSDLLVERHKDTLFNQIEVVHRGEYFGVGHVLLAGLELGRQRNDSKSVSRNIARVRLFNPTPFGHAPFGAPTNSSRAVADVVGLYLQNQITFGEHWKALVGVRYDIFDAEVTDRRLNIALSSTDRVFSPRAGLVWQPTEASAFYTSYSQSFQPSGENLSLSAANAVLEPEKTEGYEAGGKLDLFGGSLSANAALFRLERTNIKTTDPATLRLINVGEQRTDGFELELTGEPVRGWKLSAGYAYLDAKIVRSTTVTAGIPLQGKAPLNTPMNSASLWSTYKFPIGFAIGVGVNHVGKRFGRDDNTILLPAYTTMDALLSYEQKHYEIALNLRNLTDKKYFESVNFIGHSNFPGAPLSAVLTLRVKF